MADKNLTGFDTIIIGAGSAGCVLAARLSEDAERSVCLIEAGGPATDPAVADPLQWPRLQGTAIDWSFCTVPQRHTADRRHAWPRGRAIGGSSAMHAMAHVRGHSSDFDGWAASGCEGWGYRDLLPYFIRSETSDRPNSPYHGRDGPLRLMTPAEPHPITLAYMAAGEELGIEPTDEHNGARMSGPTLNTLTIVEGRRQSVADAYLTPARQRGSLKVIDEALVVALELEGTRCRGVRISRGGREETLVADKEVVLAAGTIGSPALLLRSGIGPAGGLRDLGIPIVVDLPGVGQNLQDHLLSGGNLYRARREVPPSKYQHSESLMYVGASGAPELVLACVVVPVVTEVFEAPPAGEAYTIMFGFTHPSSRGTLCLRSGDPRDPPIIDPRYLSEDADRKRYLEALTLARAVGHAQALGEWRSAEILPGAACSTPEDKREFLARAAFTHHHPVGTCRMGRNEDAVAGPDLAVRGLEGLYVVDASIMPTLTTGPTNAAVVAIAERASDLLRGRKPL